MGNGLQWLGDRLAAAARWAVETLGSWLTAAFGLLRTVGDSELAAMVGLVKAAVPSSSAILTGNEAARINAFFPLSESLALLTAYGAAWLAVKGYRIVKSWLPTVSS